MSLRHDFHQTNLNAISVHNIIIVMHRSAKHFASLPRYSGLSALHRLLPPETFHKLCFLRSNKEIPWYRQSTPPCQDQSSTVSRLNTAGCSHSYAAAAASARQSSARALTVLTTTYPDDRTFENKAGNWRPCPENVGNVQWASTWAELTCRRLGSQQFTCWR